MSILLAKHTPLLLRACMDGAFGTVHSYDGGSVYEAGFLYLCGKANASLLAQFPDKWRGRMFICLSEAWGNALTDAYPDITVTTRTIMKQGMLPESLMPIPDGYALRDFDKDAYRARPFGHGVNYATEQAFEEMGAGAVVWYGGEIVASASSYLSYRNEVELDVSTHPKHRHKGLAFLCAYTMIRQCEARGITVHWDAQNAASKRLAEKLGFREECVYPAYSFITPND